MNDEAQAGSADRIRLARERLGLQTPEVAAEIGIGLSAYDDLESYDDEVWTTITLDELNRLSTVLHTDIAALLGIDRDRVAPGSMEELLDRIRLEIAGRAESVDEFGERAGWDVASALEMPEAAWRVWNVDCLIDVCESVSYDWRRILCMPNRN